MTFAEQFEIFKNNVFPIMLEDFAGSLGVTINSLERLGVGFYPKEQAWIFAERDAEGEIIGLLRRYQNGKKFMIEGSKRGLIYPYNQDYRAGENKYEAGRFYWVRIATAKVTCPICGKQDWCMVSSDNPENPSAVLCSRISERSVREIPGSGYLHILDSKRQTGKTYQGIIPQSELPILIVEGASDVLAAMDLGFVAIGRPSAEGGMELLKEMPLANKEIWVVGDNDAGVGKEGMQKTLLNIKHLTENVKCFLPPQEIKDLRQWLRHGLTQQELFEYAGQYNIATVEDPNLFQDDVAYIIAEQFIKNHHTLNGTPILRNYHGQWIRWNQNKYEEVSLPTFKGEVYSFLDGKKFLKKTANGDDTVPYKPTGQKVRDIIDALNTWCPIDKDPPVWLDNEKHPHPSNLIIFKNGMLDVNEYIKGNIILHNPNPDLFTYGVLPYEFDSNLWSTLFIDFCNQVFNEDKECIRVLAQWFGYNLVPDMSQEKLMIFTGPTRSGKGTTIEVLHSILGKDQYCATSFQALATQFGCAPFIGKLATTLGDAKTPRKGEADAALQTILQIVGRDSVSIRPLYQSAYDAYLCNRFTIAMNDLPTFTDYARALVARSIILNFPNSYLGREDFTLKDRLRKEAREGKLINFALWGLKDLRRRGRFTIPKSSESLLQQLTEITSPMTAFVEECCIRDMESFTPKDQLYEAWQYWCAKAGHASGSKILFGRWLRQTCPDVMEFRPEINDRRQYTLRGIALQNWVYQQYLGRPK